MTTIKGLSIAGNNIPMGEYYECGANKVMTFEYMMLLFLTDKPLPKTFEKYHSLEPLCQVNGTCIVPGHINFEDSKS